MIFLELKINLLYMHVCAAVIDRHINLHLSC